MLAWISVNMENTNSAEIVKSSFLQKNNEIKMSFEI